MLEIYKNVIHSTWCIVKSLKVQQNCFDTYRKESYNIYPFFWKDQTKYGPKYELLLFGCFMSMVNI